MRLESEILFLNRLVATQRGDIQELRQINQALLERDSQRLDEAWAKQTAILDARLGLNQPAPPPTQAQVKPIGRNRNWQADFERRRREEHWRKVIDEQERADKKGAPPAEADKQEATSQTETK